ncbi:transposase [Streptomyces sp. WAC 06725]|uniref:transposase n=1 Tax=Streptomyces sp. WAC 06725 TaxID=2203209 RepID=UPI00163BD950|nr:transposase [Streptomyces sp. WAC 06725]
MERIPDIFHGTCDEERPELVVHVATTISTVRDIELTDTIHDELAGRQLLPGEHVVDSGYISPARIERAQRVHGITLLGPVIADHSSQARAGSGFDKAVFTIDWDNEQAICPRGATSVSWTELRMKENTYLQARFAEADCRSCPDRTRCTSSPTRPRSVAVLPWPLHKIRARNRLDQHTELWQRRYTIRAGIEATVSQNVRAHGLRRSRYRGLARTHVQHILTALACNVARLADWIDTSPRTRRRATHFAPCAQPPDDLPNITSRVTALALVGDADLWHPIEVADHFVAVAGAADLSREERRLRQAGAGQAVHRSRLTPQQSAAALRDRHLACLAPT